MYLLLRKGQELATTEIMPALGTDKLGPVSGATNLHNVIKMLAAATDSRLAGVSLWIDQLRHLDTCIVRPSICERSCGISRLEEYPQQLIQELRVAW